MWVGDSPIARPRPDALVTLSAIAARTSTCTLGTAVLLPALRHPVLLAHELATLDNLAEGRLVVGVGTGFPMPATREQFDVLASRTAIASPATCCHCSPAPTPGVTRAPR